MCQNNKDIDELELYKRAFDWACAEILKPGSVIESFQKGYQGADLKYYILRMVKKKMRGEENEH